MTKKAPVTLAQIKLALTLDLAKMFKFELAQLTKAKSFKALMKTSAYDCSNNSKTANLICRFEDQEAM